MGIIMSRLQEEGHEHSSYGAVGHELGSKKGASIVESGESGRSDEALSLQSWSPPLWLQRLLAVFFYYVLGCAYYGASPTCQWDPAEVFYFVCISISTVGYGDSVPTSDADKLFTIFYITFGLSVIYAGLSNAVGELFEKLEKDAAARKKHAAGGTVNDKASVPAEDYDVALKELWKILFCAGAVVGTMVAGGVVASTIEGWTFIQGMYWAFQTTTTVGYGDEAMSSPHYMWFSSLYALLSVAIVAWAFTGIASAHEEAKSERYRRTLLRKGLDKEMIIGLEKVEGEGVECDFVVGMLVAMGVVTDSDIAPLVKRFTELDADGSGRLDHDDLALFAEQQQMLASNRRHSSRTFSKAPSPRVNEEADV